MVIALISSLKLTFAISTFFLFYVSLKKSKRQFLSFFFIACVYNIISLFFFYDFLPGDWTPSVPFQYFIVTIFIVSASLFSSLAFLLVPYGFSIIKRLPRLTLFHPLLFGFLFFLSDIARSLLLSLFYLGKESSIGLRLFLGSLGETLTFTPLSLFAYKGGVYFLTFVLATLCYTAFSCIEKKRFDRPVFLSFSFLFFWSFILLIAPRAPLPQISVDFVTTNFDTIQKGEEAKTYTNRYNTLQDILTTDTTEKDLIILPESTYFLALDDVLATSSATSSYRYILDSGDLQKRTGKYSFSFFKDTLLDVTEVRGKDDLMIFNEYSSYVADTLYTLIASKEAAAKYHKNIDSVRGGSYNTFNISNTPYTFAALLCSEATSLSPILSFEKKNPSFYVLQSNLLVMHEKPLALSEYYNYSKLLALTTGKPVISVANRAPSFVYDGYGRRLQKTAIGTTLHKAF